MPRVSVGRAERDTRPHFLYRFYDRTGVLLYIGITVDFSERQKHHAKHKGWWPQVDQDSTKVEYYNGRRAALDAERLAIKAERPLENDQHNEFVEVADNRDEFNEPHSLDEFVSALLDAAGEDELDAVISDNQHDFDGNKRTDRGRDIAAAFSLLTCMAWERELLVREMKELRVALKLSGDQRWWDYMSELREEMMRLGSLATDQDKDRAFLTAVTAAKAADYLDGLPGDEGVGWRDCAVTVLNFRGTQAAIDSRAAEIAYRYKLDGSLPKGLCSGPNHTGARCSRKDLVETQFEVCPICADGMACVGHEIWCHKHDSMARSGRLLMFDDSPLARYPVRDTRSLPMVAA